MSPRVFSQFADVSEDSVPVLADALIDALAAQVEWRNAVRRDDRELRREGRVLYADPGAMR